MKSIVRSTLIAPLLALMAAVQKVEAGELFQVVAYHRSLPAPLLEEMENKSSSTIDYLQQFLENCTFAEPGGVLAGRRELWWEVGDENEAVEDVASAPTTLAAHRELFTSCPDSCSKSGSRSCTQAGCAYCGRCRRRRGRKLQSTTARLVGRSGNPATAFPLGVRSMIVCDVVACRLVSFELTCARAFHTNLILETTTNLLPLVCLPQLCEADCDSDSDCRSGYKCWRRDVRHVS
jgi:hypothetical protein